ncbi:MAG: hypothetical protein WBA12_11665, partial [Catalinimonas sp.]
PPRRRNVLFVRNREVCAHAAKGTPRCAQSSLPVPSATDQDPLGRALLDRLDGHAGREIRVTCDRADNDVIPVDYLFR